VSVPFYRSLELRCQLLNLSKSITFIRISMSEVGRNINQVEDCRFYLPQQCLYFLPEPQGQGSFLFNFQYFKPGFLGYQIKMGVTMEERRIFFDR